MILISGAKLFSEVRVTGVTTLHFKFKPFSPNAGSHPASRINMSASSSSSSSASVSVIHWFRKGLRLHDNPALVAAVEKVQSLPKAHLRPVFILDTKIIQSYRVGANRWRFLVSSLEDLDKSLRALGSRLYVLRGDPISQFEFMFQNWNVKFISYESDTEPYAKVRDVEIFNLAQKAGVELKTYFSHTLYAPSTLLLKNKSEAPKTYQKFLDVVSKAGEPPLPIPKIKEIYLKWKPKQDDMNPDLYKLLTLEELNVDKSKLGVELYPGGESEALKRLDSVMVRKSYISNFEKPNTSPNSIEPSTTVLSPYLKFGCLSARLFYTKLKEIKPQKSKPPVSLLGQLYWREFYYLVGTKTPNFTKMIGNPICKQINWDVNPEYLNAWTEGRTGYPFIDAIMTQLRNEGWIHHLARHAVACFLTRGDLWISWEEGQLVFEELLLDADIYLNAGNWMWLSASAFFHQYYRVYSPIVFGKKTDPHGNYIRKYLPKLAKYPPEYIYEPWTAPVSVQKACGCIIGHDYPKPIVDHATIHKINLQRMNEAYKKPGTATTSKSSKSTPVSSSSRNSKPDNSDSGEPFAKMFKGSFC